MSSAQQGNKALYKALKQLGLTDHEAGLYTLSLSLGPLPLSDLAEKMHISRPNIYKILKGLERQGLVALPAQGKQKRFSVLSPTVVSELLERKGQQEQTIKKEFASFLPDFLVQYRRGDIPSHVRIYQGRGQYRGAFYDMLDEAKTSCDFFGSLDDFLSLFDLEEQREWLQERVRRGITAKTLALPGDHAGRLAAEDREYLRETRILEGLGSFQSSFHLFADKVMLWQPESLLAIRIEDDLIFSMYKSLYAFLWEQAKRPVTSNLGEK